MALREPYTEAARYALLSELALSLSEASDMEALTREFVPKLKYMIDFNRCTLALLEEDGTTYRLLILLETRQETSQASSDNISLQCGISGKVILSEEMCVLDSRGRNWVKQWPIADEAMEGGSLNSIMCLPLQVSGKPFGAITFGTGQIGYSRADISTASIIANHLSLAIDRWNMIQKLRSANEEIQKLNAELETRVQERTDELAKTNKQLSEEKERYRNLYLKTPAVLHSIDAEGELVSVSDFWLEKFGYTRSEEVIGRKSLEFLTEESKKFAMTEAIPQMKKQGYVREFPFQFVKKNGEIMDILLSATVELDENGNYRRSLAVLEDVTERQRAEERLRASEERYRSLYTKTPVLLHSIDATGKLISVSDYWLDNLGYELNEVIGRRIPEFLTQASRQDAENIFLPEFFKTGFLKEAELQFVKKNGEVIDVLLSAIAERDAKGEIVRSMAVLVDVTERKQAKEALQKAHDELEIRVQERTAELSEANELLANKNEELESFAYSVSHDLQAPLRSIDGFSKALLEDCADKLTDSGKDFLNRVRAASQRMGHLIDDMLHLSRVSRREMIPKKIDLSAMAKAITRELHEEQSERQVTFVITPDVEVSGDVHLLRIALENLLDNAWKYTSKHPRAKIEFGVTEHEGKKAYFVRDDGAGFDTKFVGKLFGPFQRLHRSNEFEGNGIGLATVQRIIHRHGGRVWAEGAVEKGATFFFTLP